MGAYNKLLKLGGMALSSTRETLKTKLINGKIDKLTKEMEKEKNPEVREYLSRRKRVLENELLKTIQEEKSNRKKSAEVLKKDVKFTMEKRKEESKGVKLPSKVTKEFKNLPIVTVFDDLIEGASGIEKAEEYLKSNQEKAYSYLLIAETIKYHKKTFLTIHGVKAPIDILGTVIDVTSEYLGGFVENITDKDKWTYERALKQALSIAIGKKNEDRENLIIAGRSAFLLAWDTKNINERQRLLALAREFYERALEEDSLIHLRGEVLFYLGEMYGSVGDKTAFGEYLYKSINEGFYPAIEEYKKLVSKRGAFKNHGPARIPRDVRVTKAFKFSMRRNFIDAALGGTVNVIKKQSKKLSNTTERIIDKAVDKFMK